MKEDHKPIPDFDVRICRTILALVDDVDNATHEKLREGMRIIQSYARQRLSQTDDWWLRKHDERKNND